MSFNFIDEAKKLIDKLAKHEEWRRKTINLIASENVTSPLVDFLYANDMMHRYAEGLPFKRFYQGTKYIDEIEYAAQKLMSYLFKAKYVDIRPISGTIANAAVFETFKGKRRIALSCPLEYGGHVSHSEFGLMKALGLRVGKLPFNYDEMNIDVDKALKIIYELKPDFIVLGGSLMINIHPVKELASACKEVGTKVVFDAAHVLGLIAGETYPNPLKEGADVMTASTHKTFPGPQGGVIMTDNDEYYKKLKWTIFPVFVSNHHLHRLICTAITCIEMILYGKEYAQQIIKNAKTLAEELHDLGFKVLGEKIGFTKTHQVVIDVRDLGGGDKVAKLLEEANIIVNKNILPGDDPRKPHRPSGIRMGVQEVTRRGMREDEMRQIAEFIARVIIKREDPAKVRKEVEEFMARYNTVKFCLEANELKEEIEKLKKIWSDKFRGIWC